jgi:hypothetical protein
MHRMMSSVLHGITAREVFSHQSSEVKSYPGPACRMTERSRQFLLFHPVLHGTDPGIEIK